MWAADRVNPCATPVQNPGRAAHARGEWRRATIHLPGQRAFIAPLRVTLWAGSHRQRLLLTQRGRPAVCAAPRDRLLRNSRTPCNTNAAPAVRRVSRQKRAGAFRTVSVAPRRMQRSPKSSVNPLRDVMRSFDDATQQTRFCTSAAATARLRWLRRPVPARSVSRGLPPSAQAQPGAAKSLRPIRRASFAVSSPGSSRFPSVACIGAAVG